MEVVDVDVMKEVMNEENEWRSQAEKTKESPQLTKMPPSHLPRTV
jgi:hypothetical protein